MSSDKVDGPGGRREFLKTWGRVAVGCALGLGVAELVAGRGRRCSTPDLCAECRALASCRLPAALDLKAGDGRQ